MNARLNDASSAHTVAECRGYLERAGFTTITDHEFVPDLLHRVSGTKPA